MITPSFSPTATERVLPKLALDFTTASLDSRVTFTRTTGASNPATYVNSSGVITAATNNQPRFDYDPVTLACKGLLIEESRTNVLLSNSDFRSSANGNSITFWTNTRITVPSVDSTSPANEATVYKIQEDTTASSSHSFGGAFSAVSGTTYTASVFVKATDTRFLRITFATTAFPSSATATINPVNGDFIVGSGSISAQVVAYPNGWYRLIVTAAATTTAATSISFNLTTSINGSISYSGNGTSGLLAWGAQLEVGAFATSYIPTTSAALTRNADVATMTGTNFSDWFNASEGTFVFGGDLYQFVAGKAHLAAFANSTNYISIRTAPSGSTQSRMEIGGGANTCVLSPVTITPAGFQEAFAYKLNNCAAAVNAGTVVTDTTVDLPATTPTALNIGSNPSAAQQLNGHAAYLAYYPQRLTDAEVQAFSKQG